PKEFIESKKPKTDLERITCLAYYLTHHRNTPQFKTREITDLNREAAQPRFSNPAATGRNAVSLANYLALAGGGQKYITSVGEALVRALPDREKARAEIERRHRPKSRRGRTKKKKLS
ncbi:MAG: hypothetical protein HY594_00560, partial [Candidatus Omnitrophica bacterium]|nr:hypothetical protein [Candidatus Omnitrophota bacterium]